MLVKTRVRDFQGSNEAAHHALADYHRRRIGTSPTFETYTSDPLKRWPMSPRVRVTPEKPGRPPESKIKHYKTCNWYRWAGFDLLRSKFTSEPNLETFVKQGFLDPRWHSETCIQCKLCKERVSSKFPTLSTPPRTPTVVLRQRKGRSLKELLRNTIDPSLVSSSTALSPPPAAARPKSVHSKSYSNLIAFKSPRISRKKKDRPQSTLGGIDGKARPRPQSTLDIRILIMYSRTPI
eukprot:sb/3469263/